MEVCIISKEMVKPSSPEVCLRKPFMLSMLDQFTPAIYQSPIFFYGKPKDSDLDTAQILAQLRKSLLKALNQFYPLSGRTIDNLYIGSYEKGVPYVEARVKGHLSDSFALMEQGWLNRYLLPSQGGCSIPTSTSPILAIQVSIFDCGGVAIGLCNNHKLVDGTTMSTFLSCWEAFNRGSNDEIPNTDVLDAGSRLFPPLESVPQKYLSLIESLWFQEGWYKTKIFVFDEHAIATLKLKAKSKRLEHPTRTETLAAFLWKYAMLASREASGRSKPSTLTQRVNLRPRMKLRLPKQAIGNLLVTAVSTYNSAESDIKLHQLAYLVREAIDTINNQIPDLQNGGLLKFMTDQFNQTTKIAPQGDLDCFDCTSLLNTIDEGQADFGWGQPILMSFGTRETRYHSLVKDFFLREIEKGKAIEANVTSDAKAIDILEYHSDFLAFASPDLSPYYPNKSKI